MIVGIDFDNTIVLDEWPYVGPVLPGAIETLKELQEAGHKIILYTQRTDQYNIYCPELEEYKKKMGGFLGTVDLLSPAKKLLEDNGIELFACNCNPDWELKMKDHGRKVYFDLLIDDHCAGIKYKEMKNSSGEICKTIDWVWLKKWLKENNYI